MSENSKQRKRIRTITPSLLLLFAIGCESTMVGPEYDDYDNSDTTYTEYLETDTIETDTIDFEYNDDDGLPWIPPPFIPSDSLDDSIPEFPSDTANTVDDDTTYGGFNYDPDNYAALGITCWLVDEDEFSFLHCNYEECLIDEPCFWNGDTVYVDTTYIDNDTTYVDSLWYLYPVDTSIECITLEGFDCSMP